MNTRNRILNALKANPQAVGLFLVALINHLVGVGLLEAISPETLEAYADAANFAISTILFLAAIFMPSPREERKSRKA